VSEPGTRSGVAMCVCFSGAAAPLAAAFRIVGPREEGSRGRENEKYYSKRTSRTVGRRNRHRQRIQIPAPVVDTLVPTGCRGYAWGRGESCDLARPQPTTPNRWLEEIRFPNRFPPCLLAGRLTETGS